MDTSFKKSFTFLLFGLILVFNVLGAAPASASDDIVHVPLSLPAGWTEGYNRDIWGSSVSDVYAVGFGSNPQNPSMPLLYRKHGASWAANNLSLPVGFISGDLTGVWGSDASNVYAAGSAYDASYDRFPLIYHTNDDIHWTKSTLPLPVGEVEGFLSDIWGPSASDIYAVGQSNDAMYVDKPLLYHYNGTNWMEASPSLPASTEGYLAGVWGSSSGDVYAVGSIGVPYRAWLPLLYHNTGTGWAVINLSLPAGFAEGYLGRVWGSGAKNVYAVGTGDDLSGHRRPLVYHYDGIGWVGSSLTLPAGSFMGFGTGIWGSSANDVYLVGYSWNVNGLSKPLMYHNDGTGWTEVGLSLPAEFSQGSLFTVWGPSANNIFIAGSGIGGAHLKPLLYQKTNEIVISGNAGVAGATINYTGGSTTTDSSGNYSFTVISSWSGTVTPSKANYIFSPTSRTYSNVTINQNAQNYTTTRLYSISGNTGVGGVTVSYTHGTPKTVISQANGNYSFQVPSGWAGTVTPSRTGYIFAPVNRTYANVVVDTGAQNYTATRTYGISGNVGASGVKLSYTDSTAKTVTSQLDGSYSIIVPENWSGTVTPAHACFTFNPVDLSYTNIASDQTAQDYTPSLNAGCSDVNVTIGGVDQARYGLSAGSSTRASYAGLDKGPVKVESTNAIPLIAAERLIYKVNNVATSFSEMMALPDSQLDTVYWLPWYNSKSLNTQLRIANVSASEAIVHISIGGTPVTGSPFSIPAGVSKRLSFPGIDRGPVKIESNVNVLASERVIYKVTGRDTSYSEMMALPNSQLDTIYWLPWYNSKSLDTQLRIANVSPGEATVTVTIGGAPAPGSPFTLALGASKRLSFPDIDKGPVRIESTGQVIASERVIYKLNGAGVSFSETMALPNSQLDTTYWLPWYNNKNTDSQLRIANVSDTEATVNVSIGGAPVLGSPFTILAGGSKRLSFAGIDKGPVRIESNVNVVASERVIYKVNSVVTSFSEMMGLPDRLLDTTYWLPWYNNVDLDTQLRFGRP